MNFQNILYALPAVLIGLTAHEFCHAFAAYKLGDNTAREQGRLSFNPLKHIDLIGFLFIIFAGFGWAKPVQFTPENLRHPRRDKAIIAAAGPLSNLALALVFTALIRLWFTALQSAAFLNMPLPESIVSILASDPFTGFIYFLIRAAEINLGLFVFNLIPVPPLDGSHIVFSGLNLKPETEQKIMKIGAPLFFIILIIQNRMDIEILPIGRIVYAILIFLLPQFAA